MGAVWWFSSDDCIVCWNVCWNKKGLANYDPYDQNDPKRRKPAEGKCKHQDEKNFGQINFLDTDTIQGKTHARVVFTDRFGKMVVREANQ